MLFVACKMTQNNTPSKVHVAATELPQLLSHNTKSMFVEATAKAARCYDLTTRRHNVAATEHYS